MSQDLLNNNLKKKGYTLIEVMIAVMFFAIVVLGLSLPFSNSISLTVDDRNINVSGNLARSYIRDTQTSWNTQNSFDIGQLVSLNNNYTNNGIYKVTVASQAISRDANNNVIVRRLNIKYQDSRGNTLVDMFYDFNRPGSL